MRRVLGNKHPRDEKPQCWPPALHLRCFQSRTIDTTCWPTNHGGKYQSWEDGEEGSHIQGTSGRHYYSVGTRLFNTTRWPLITSLE